MKLRDLQLMTTSPNSRARADMAPAPRRWAILAVLCLSVFVIVIDGTIVNVALPTLVRDLGATNSELQWIVDAYTLVFASLLLVAGSIGDRFGRRPVLQWGMAVFAATSLLAALVDSPAALIAARAAMGVGAALIFPATLAILVNVFTVPRERAMAIGIWAAISGLAVALGPVTGGWLLEHFHWGSVFLVNLPIAAISLIGTQMVVPNSKDPHVARFDPLGMILSTAMISMLVWAIIEGPNHGWLSPTSLAAFAVAAALLVAFTVWELRSDHPMLDVGVFTNARFSAGSVSVTFAFFALFGFTFMVTQYFQFVRGYGTLLAGLCTVPFALFTGIAAPASTKLAERFGTKAIVVAGLLSMALGFLVAAVVAADAPYGVLVIAMFFMGGGVGLVNAPATEAIMGALPPERAGVGSAVNDTTRELGGTLGVALVGSLFSSVYASRLDDALVAYPQLPAGARAAARDSVGAAFEIARRVGEQAGPQAGQAFKAAVDASFVDGFHAGSLVAAAVVVIGAAVAYAFLPSRAARAGVGAASAAGQAGFEREQETCLAGVEG